METAGIWLSAALSAAAVWRIWQLKLIGKFPLFVSMLLAISLRTAVLAAIGRRGSAAYTYVWMATEIVVLVLWVAAALELYRRTCDRYPGIGRFATWLLCAATTVAVTVALLLPGWGKISNPLQTLFYARQGVGVALAGTLGLTAGFFARFAILPEVAPSNLIRHHVILATYFITQAACYLAILATEDAITFGAIATIAAVCCYIAWIVALTPAGERVPVIERTPEMDGVEDRVSGLLDLVRRVR